jgi:hypothetical protein
MSIQDFISSLPWQTIIFCFLGFALILVSIFTSSTSKKLKESGTTVDGIIFSLGASNRVGSDNYSTNVKDRITVRFLTTDNVWITEQLKANFLVAYIGQYKEGETVKIIYDPQNPSNFVITTKQSEKIGRVVVALGGIVFLVVGILKYLDK